MRVHKYALTVSMPCAHPPDLAISNRKARVEKGQISRYLRYLQISSKYLPLSGPKRYLSTSFMVQNNQISTKYLRHGEGGEVASLRGVALSHHRLITFFLLLQSSFPSHYPGFTGLAPHSPHSVSGPGTPGSSLCVPASEGAKPPS